MQTQSDGDKGGAVWEYAHSADGRAEDDLGHQRRVVAPVDDVLDHRAVSKQIERVR